MIIETPKLTERRWMQQLVSTSRDHPGLATIFGWHAWHDNATNAPRACPSCKAPLKLPRNDPGWPDLFLLRDTVLWVVELKTDRGVLTAEQTAYLEAFRAVQEIRVAVWHPRDLDRITRLLR